MLTMRSRIDSATTGFGNSPYQSWAILLAVKIVALPATAATSA
ncbi:MAG: hypothetical protein ACLQNG_06960 [Acidimicrobiales bacterium]